MYLTEEEAGSRICGLQKAMSIVGLPIMGLMGIRLKGADAAEYTEALTCVASECMMWRERRELNESGTPDTVTGYCGLAGKL